MPLLGGLAALLVGVTLGLLGGGGSILTVPVLVYLFGISATQGTGASLLVVGASALFAAFAAWRQGDFEWGSAWPFAVGSVPTVFAVRAWVVPAIPESLGTVGGVTVTRDMVLMVSFGVLMLAAGGRMLMPSDEDAPVAARGIWFLVGLGVVTGLLAGMVGAGGGFMIVPALVLGAGMGMKTAVGTSLGIIAVQSLAGFAGAAGGLERRVLETALIVCGLALVGVLGGRWISGRVEAGRLRPMFAWFVVGMGVFVLLKELVF